jgi:hypothetical protein
MPPKKTEREKRRSKPAQAPALQIAKIASDTLNGRSGQGSESALAHLKEQETTRVPPPERR